MQKIIDDIKKSIENISDLNLSTAEIEDNMFSDCPHCGEGEVDLTQFINIDKLPLNVEFSGIGECVKNAQDYFESVSPDKIKKLLEGIEKMHKELNMWRND